MERFACCCDFPCEFKHKGTLLGFSSLFGFSPLPNRELVLIEPERRHPL
jgi:hypothetical protein